MKKRVNQGLKRGIAIAALAFMSVTTIFATPSYLSKEQLRDKAQKTINYYHEGYKDKNYRGILDWPALGLFAFGEDLSGPKWTIGGQNGATFREQEVRKSIGLSTTKNTDFERTIIGLTAAGKDPRNFGGKNLVESVKGTMLANGHFADSVKDNKTGKPVGETLVNAHIFGIIALHCVGEPIPNRDKCLEWLSNTQHKDGGFTWDVKYFDNPEHYNKVVSDIDMTAAGLMAYAILGEDLKSPHVQRAITFLKDEQLDNGGFSSWGTENPESCAWATQAIRLMGEDPMGPDWTKASGGNPVTAILQFQLKDGSFTHVLNEEDNLPVYNNAMSTEQALYGLADGYNTTAAYDMLFNKYKPSAKNHVFKDFKEGEYGFKEALELSYDYVLLIDEKSKFNPKGLVTQKELQRMIDRLIYIKPSLKKVDTKWIKGNVTGKDFASVLEKMLGIETEHPIENVKAKQLLSEDIEASKTLTKAQVAFSLYQVKHLF